MLQEIVNVFLSKIKYVNNSEFLQKKDAKPVVKNEDKKKDKTEKVKEKEGLKQKEITDDEDDDDEVESDIEDTKAVGKKTIRKIYSSDEEEDSDFANAGNFQ